MADLARQRDRLGDDVIRREQVVGETQALERAKHLVHPWIQENYADSMLMGLRRILDDDRRTFSLIRLLRDIQRDPSLLTVDRYVRLCTSRYGDSADGYARAIDRRFSANGCTLERQRIDSDIRTLRAKSQKVLQYINSAVAHHTSSGDDSATPSVTVTWQDLDTLFDDVTELFNKYYGLVKPGVHVDFSPVLPAGFEQAFHRMLDVKPANKGLQPAAPGGIVRRRG